MQWISVGSGIEHAEGGGTPQGEEAHGFQIWVNVPKERKMDDPRYGTISSESIPVIKNQRMESRLLAGTVESQIGPFETVTPVQIIDVSLAGKGSYRHTVPENYDNCLVYVYRGKAAICGAVVSKRSVVRLDASRGHKRTLEIVNVADEETCFLVFAGVRLNEPIAWHGPFVMNSRAEVIEAILEYQQGTFLKRCAQWDYKRIASGPSMDKSRKDHTEAISSQCHK